LVEGDGRAMAQRKRRISKIKGANQ